MSANYHIQSNADLMPFNTMRLGCIADKLVLLSDESQVSSAVAMIKAKGVPLFILSGGSNVILPSRLKAYVVKPDLRGIKVLSEDASSISIEVMAGESWHTLVVTSVTNGWYGLENLALIPGLTGAAPVQNIGAYGAQLEDTLTHVRAYHLATATWHTLTNNDCGFGYRSSKFKQEAGQWLITRVGFRLFKDAKKVSTEYGDVAALASKLATANHRTTVHPIDIMHAVIDIRQSKLPNPEELPNCGSFFKNPIIPAQQFLDLRKRYPNLVGYKVDEEHTKVAAGWLIDKAGLKGSGIPPIMTHINQALVLVNQTEAKSHRVATQADIQATQDFIQKKIQNLFSINLEREPVWIDSSMLV